MSGGKLPEGWVKSDLDNILLSIIGGGTPSKAIPEYYQGDIPWMSVKDMNKHALTDTIDHITSDAVENSSTNVIPAGTPIIATRMSLGKIVTASFDSAINQDLKALFLSREVDRNFFIHWYRSQAQLIESLGTGTTVKGIRLEVLKALTINLPPLTEQKIIAEKLDTLLAQVDSTKARLEQIPKILKRFRQAVLAAAASGRLTNKWRENNTQKEEINLIASKYKPTDSLFKQAKLSLPEIPHSWYVVPSAHLIDYVTSGSRGWANYYSTEGALFLRMSNVRYNTTKLDLQDLQFVNLPSQVEGKRSLVKIDDLIISLTADVGRVARIDKDLGEAYINQHLALLRPNNNINSEYFALCIAAQNIGVKQIQSLKRGATKVGLGLDDIRSLAIPLPSLEEQRQIVRRVEQLFAYADTIEKQVNNALTRVNSLTQSILAKAFRGELTAQWRAENPDLISGENSAAALLEKIKAERAASGGKKTSRKKA
ncbi:restriction endonuclease subunit S [Salmonella enterica subsp. enterica]|nr:restriction endonuclease subunit S [Salmonella enterica subsp. enterica]